MISHAKRQWSVEAAVGMLFFSYTAKMVKTREDKNYCCSDEAGQNGRMAQ